jgi:hypothetical protein
MSTNKGAVGPPTAQRPGSHRSSPGYPMATRVLAAGSAALCIGFLAEMNAPDADALAILLPAGNGNATQINILEGNVFNPQFGMGGNSSITQTIGNIIFGQGNSSSQGTSGGGIFGPIALGGATGNGNVTQINILSFNIFNPQASLNGSNYSNNKTVSNVAVGNGNHSENDSSSSGGPSMIGGAAGNGNTRQFSLFSGNIFNPQFSLFGDNYSNNTAITNVSLFNGNFSNNSSTGSGGLGFLGALLGNGNTNQIAIGVTNIINPQFSFLGKNWSYNNTTTNLSGANGNYSNNQGSTGGIAGTANGNGNTRQDAWSGGNIINEQFRLGSPLGGTPATAPAPDAVNTGNVVVVGTNTTDTWLPGMPVPEPLEELVDQGNAVVEGTNASVAGAAGSNTAGTTNRPRLLSTVVNQVRTVLDQTRVAVNTALGVPQNAPSTSQPPSSQPESGDPPSAADPGSGA